jgi:hypothetical protein|uniref:PIN domain-containing protein n=1 Tax=Prosthecobacter sp. TaxID=1965333 RepID=UPI0037853269
MSKNNYIFVDYESVQEIDLALIEGKPVKVWLFIGVQQKKVPVELMTQVHRLHAQVELVQVERVGKNALDFILAHHTGGQAAADSEGFFHILSKDKGFDALVANFKSRKMMAARSEVFASLPMLVDVRSLSLQERVQQVRSKLTGMLAGGLPGKLKKLRSTISAHFREQLSEKDVEAVLQELRQSKVIKVSNESVSYLMAGSLTA